jgi:hypothetical protein
MKNAKRQKQPSHPLHDLLKRLQSLIRRRPEPEDPYAYRVATLRRPPNKGGAAAVAELDED